jgi:EmrB/QacA subfamily drug resistance transporter
MVAAILGSSIVFLDGLVVAVALERIGQELPASAVGVLEGQTYVSTGYFATLAAFLILGGALSDHYGRRKVFTIGLLGFGVTSVICGLAPTMELLIVGRLLQGVAGALLVPGSLAIITATFEGQQRARAFGIWAAATSAASVVGPVVGGVLIGLSWRAAFLINVPLVLVALWATRRFMAESRDEGAGRDFDWLGASIAVIAVGCLTLGLVRGEQSQWADPLAMAALAVGAVAIVAFPLRMARASSPLVPLGLFRSRAFATINLSTFLIYGAIYSVIGFQSLFFQGTLGYSPVAAAFLTIPSWVFLAVLSTRVGTLAGRLGPRRFLVIGPALMALGLLWLARIPATSAPWDATLGDPSSLVPPTGTLVDVLPYLLLYGVGLSLVVAPLTTTLMSSVPVAQAGRGSAINNAISRVGQPLLGALLFVAITAAFYGSLGRLLPDTLTSSAAFRTALPPLNAPAPGTSPALTAASRIASTEAFHLALVVGAGLLLGGSVVNGVGLRTKGERTAGAEPAATRVQA